MKKYNFITNYRNILKKDNLIIRLFVISFCIFLTFNFINLKAQLRKGSSFDKVVALVGKDLILQSDIDQNMAILLQSNPTLKFDDKDLRQRVLDNLINEKLMVLKAYEDSIEVSDEEISQRWNEFLSGMIRQYGSEKRVEDVIGKSLNRAKYEYTDLIKQRLLVDKISQAKFANIALSRKEVEEFYETYKDSVKNVPPKLSLYHIVKNVKVSNDVKNQTYEKALKIRDSILAGGDFGEFAKKYSSDPGSATDGGNLGWFDKGKLFPEFEKAAMSLQKGEISMPIETPFGYHIIQTLDKKKDALNTKHILFKIGLSDENTNEVIKYLEELKVLHKNGELFEELAKKHSDDKDTKGFGGFLGKLQLDEMPPNLRDVISELQLGEVSKPLPYGADPLKPSLHIIYKKEYIAEHKMNLTDDYKSIEQLAMVAKRQKLMSDWFIQLRKELYWELR